MWGQQNLGVKFSCGSTKIGVKIFKTLNFFGGYIFLEVKIFLGVNIFWGSTFFWGQHLLGVKSVMG